MAQDGEFFEVSRALDNWSRWMRHNPIQLGYPSKSLAILSGGQSVSGVFEEICDDLDNQSAEVMDALVHDLPLNQRGAIYRRWLHCTIIVRNHEQCLLNAYVALHEGMKNRGIL